MVVKYEKVIKEFLMTIARIFKYFIIIFVIIFFLILLDRLIYMLVSNDSSEPEFKIQGHRPILKEMVVNIESINPTGTLYTCSKVQTILFKGDRLAFSNHDVWFYKIYFSYGEQVGFLEFENLYRESGGWDRINTIYVVKDDTGIRIEYYPVVSDNRQGRKVSPPVMGLDDFFAQHNIEKADQQRYKEKFYNFFAPDQQEYKKDPLDKAFLQKIEQEPLDQKMFYDLDEVDIQKMNIPDTEKQILIKNVKGHQDLQSCN